MDFSIEDIPTCRIAYFRRIGPYGTDNMQMMESIKRWAKANGLVSDDSVLLGIARDDPATAKAESCRYDACVVLPDGYTSADGEARIGRLEGGKYAVFTIDHTAEAVRKAWSELMAVVTAQEYQFDQTKLILERYAVRMVNNHSCEICVPVQ